MTTSPNPCATRACTRRSTPSWPALPFHSLTDNGAVMSNKPSFQMSISTPNSPKPTVLVIDDQLANVRLVGALLSQSGYEVLSVLDGDEGLALAASESLDLVLLDMRMPGKDGFEVLRLLREAPATADLPIIFLTADDDRENLVRAFAAGANDYVTKPFVARELLARVR